MELIQAKSDYYPFGMVMPERTYTAQTGYRYGFNGKEADNEVKGEGNSLDFGARVYDPRIGRWLSTDPLQRKYPDLSPYQFGANNPLFWIDPDGATLKPYDENSKKGITAHFERVFGTKVATFLAQYLSMDGMKIPVDPKDFKVACKNLSSEQRTLAMQYYLIMNSDKLIVGLLGKSDTKIPNELLLARIDQRFKGKTLGDISSSTQGAITSINDGSVKTDIAAAVLINTEADFSKRRDAVLDDKGYLGIYTTNEDRTSGITPFYQSSTGSDEQVIHEFGHTLFQGIMNTPSPDGDFSTIQVSNVYRRHLNNVHKGDKAFEKLKMRSGWDHRSGSSIITHDDGSGKAKPDYGGVDVRKAPDQLKN